jgi:hypothetical protein
MASALLRQRTSRRMGRARSPARDTSSPRRRVGPCWSGCVWGQRSARSVGCETFSLKWWRPPARLLDERALALLVAARSPAAHAIRHRVATCLGLVLRHIQISGGISHPAQRVLVNLVWERIVAVQGTVVPSERWRSDQAKGDNQNKLFHFRLLGSGQERPRLPAIADGQALAISRYANRLSWRINFRRSDRRLALSCQSSVFRRQTGRRDHAGSGLKAPRSHARPEAKKSNQQGRAASVTGSAGFIARQRSRGESDTESRTAAASRTSHSAKVRLTVSLRSPCVGPNCVHSLRPA